MKIIDCEQGSDAWHSARCGRATASRVCDIMRKTKTGVSAMRETYAGELVAERFSGRVADSFKSKAMEWGSETEDQARAYYAFITDIQPVKVGLVIHPTIEMSAASPDRLVGDDGLLEIKCPNSSTHIRTLKGAPIDPDYMKQMQWQMACTRRVWCDFCSYDPRFPAEMAMKVIRVPRDDVMIAEIGAAVVSFLTEVDAMVEELTRLYRQPLAAE